MTGVFFYKPGPAGTGWELLANPEIEASLLPLSKTVLVSDNFPAGRTTIGHVARDGDHVVIMHKDRRFAGQLIGTRDYEVLGFDPFAVVVELPAADAALRAAVAWGDALAGADEVLAEAATPDTVLWQAPADTLAIALARALFLIGAPWQRRATYFSLSLRDLPSQRSVLTRFVDRDGQPPPKALLAAARALPEAAAEVLSVTLALPSAGPSEQREQAEAWQAWISVRKPALPLLSPAPSAAPPRLDAGGPAGTPDAQEGTIPLPTDTFAPPPPGRSLRLSAAPWWLSPAATGAVALLFVAWIGKEAALMREARRDAETAVEAANSASTEAARLAAEAAKSAAAAAEATADTVAAAEYAAAADAARVEATHSAADAAKSAAVSAEATAQILAVAEGAAAANAAKDEAARLAVEAAQSATAAAEAAGRADAAADRAEAAAQRGPDDFFRLAPAQVLSFGEE